jgi:hypothetical protein
MSGKSTSLDDARSSSVLEKKDDVAMLNSKDKRR